MQITIRMPGEYLSKIGNIAKKTGLKKSDITRLAIKKFIEEYTEEDNSFPADIRELIGIAESGIPDLGINHRKHIINKIKAKAR